MRAMASVAALTLALGLAGPAVADPTDPERDPGSALPSAEEVRDAKAAAAAKAGEVGRIKAAMLLANQRLEDAAVEAEHASEAYNGARWRLEQAGAALEQARADAAEARRTVAEQRDAIGALVASSYQQSTELTALSAMMSADGPAERAGPVRRLPGGVDLARRRLPAVRRRRRARPGLRDQGGRGGASPAAGRRRGPDRPAAGRGRRRGGPGGRDDDRGREGPADP